MSFKGNPNVVNLTDEQTINSEKKFSKNIFSILDANKGTAPDSNVAQTFCEFVDINKNRMGYVRADYSTGKSMTMTIQARKCSNSTDTESSSIQIVYPATGAPYTQAPASDVNNSIVTTVNKSKSANGYFKLGNGLIIQWGHWAGNGAGTITLPTPFTTTNYAPVFTDICENSNPTTAGIIKSVTSTNFKINIPTTMNGVYWVAIGY